MREPVVGEAGATKAAARPEVAIGLVGEHARTSRGREASLRIGHAAHAGQSLLAAEEAQRQRELPTGGEIDDRFGGAVDLAQVVVAANDPSIVGGREVRVLIVE